MISTCMPRPSLLTEFHSHHKVEPLRKLLAVCTTAVPGRRQKLSWSFNLKHSGCCSKGTILGVKLCCRQATATFHHSVWSIKWSSYPPSPRLLKEVTSAGPGWLMSAINPGAPQRMNKMWCSQKKKILPHVNEGRLLSAMRHAQQDKSSVLYLLCWN